MRFPVSLGRAAAVAAGVGVLLGGGLAVTAPGAGAAASLVLAPNHRIGVRPPGGGHGHGGGGGNTVTYGWASSNWSGYAETDSQPYTSITARWTVPAISASKHPTYSSAWAGIDGFDNSDLIQAGTEQDYYQGAAHYSAWWTTSGLGFLEQPIPSMTVGARDTMTAEIANDGGGQWTITLNDVTRSETFTTSVAYDGPGASAEWIVEAPTVGGRVAPLADYGTTVFDPSSVNVTTASDPGNAGFVSTDLGILVQGRSAVSVPSLPDRDTDGFLMQYGSTQPLPPVS